jgi:hypothetical protein
MKVKTLKELRERAANLGVTIEVDRFQPLNGNCWGYWLGGTGWDDDNYCADKEEVEEKLDQLFRERFPKQAAFIDDIRDGAAKPDEDGFSHLSWVF